VGKAYQAMDHSEWKQVGGKGQDLKGQDLERTAERIESLLGGISAVGYDRPLGGD
jgi:hypothetical protein